MEMSHSAPVFIGAQDNTRKPRLKSILYATENSWTIAKLFCRRKFYGPIAWKMASTITAFVSPMMAAKSCRILFFAKCRDNSGQNLGFTPNYPQDILHVDFESLILGPVTGFLNLSARI